MTATNLSSPAPRRLPFLLVLALFGLAFGLLINVLDPFLYSEKVRLLAPPWLRNTTLSFVTITSLLVAFVAQPLVGRLSDRTHTRWGRRAPYLVGGVLALSISLLLIVAADSLWLLIVAAMLTAGSSNTVQSVWHALVPDHVPAGQHGRAAGIKTLLELVGVIGGIALVGITIARGQLWAAAFIALALFWLILPATLLTIRRAGGRAKCRAGGRADNEGTLPGHFSLAHLYTLIKAVPGFDWWMVNRFLFWSSAIAVRTFILNYMEDVLLIPPAEAQVVSSRIFLMLAGGVFVLAIPTGLLTDRIGRQPLLVSAGLLAAGGSLLLVFTRETTLLFMAGGLIAVAAGIFVSSSWALATDLAPPAQAALYLGLANSASVVGSIGGRLGGPLIDGINQLSGTITLGYLVVYSIAAVFFVGSSVVVLKIPTHLKRSL